VIKTPSPNGFSICFVLLLMLCGPFVRAQTARPWHVSAAFGALAYQSSYGFQTASGVEAAVGRSLKQNLRADLGIRLGFDPALPDVFARLVAVQTFGLWQPAIGLESGYSNRLYWDTNGTQLLQETRDALTEDAGYIYLACHAEPLAFAWPNGWGISAMEVQFGTHFKNFGQTLRLQATFIRLQKTF
jgi:hypothetical protein